jgi:hypothetical protein
MSRQRAVTPIEAVTHHAKPADSHQDCRQASRHQHEPTLTKAACKERRSASFETGVKLCR